ncbi:MAG: MFS transporter [Dehalococcoidia bacterium]
MTLAEASTNAAGPVPPAGAFSSLRHRPWRELWLAGHLWHLAYWLDLIVIGWLVLELTDSAFLVSLTGTARLAPLGVLGFVAGTWADRFDKRRLLVVAQLLNLGATAAFAVVLVAGVEAVWQVYVVALITGSGWAIDFPVRRALIRDVLPDDAIPNAMALDAGSLVGSGMAGRWLAGGLLALGGAAAAYVALTVIYVAGLVMLLRLPAPPATEVASNVEDVPRPSIVADLASGLAYAWHNGALRGLLLVTLAINLLVFPYVTLVPVLVRDVFDQGPLVLGLTSGMDGLGSLLGTALIIQQGVSRGFGRLFIGGSLLAALGALALGLVPTWWLAALVLLVTGFGVSGFATMQTTIATTTAEAHMRGRAMGAVSLAIGMLPIGMFYVGFVADRIGTPEALVVHASIGVVLIAAIAAVQPALRRA